MESLVITFMVLLFALCLCVGGFCWFCIHNGQKQFLECGDKPKDRADVIELLHQRAARRQREQV